jgi:hypothetical protein
MDKQELLENIDREASEWELLLVEIGEERMEQSGVNGEWNFKDVVAHLSAWRGKTLAQLEAAQQGESTAPAYWPSGWDEEDDDDLEKINAWIYEENRERFLQDVLKDSREQFHQLRGVVRALPEEELFTPGRFAWMEGRPLADLVDFGHFHEEHEPTIEQWLNEQRTGVRS